mgnify:CR=1 FL=1
MPYNTLFKKHNIANLDSSNLKNYTKNSIILFYADWCGHCKDFIPQYVKMPNQIRKVNFAAVDGNLERNKSVLQKYNIEGFPTMLHFNSNGSYKEYNGNRTVKDIKLYINSQAKKKRKSNSVKKSKRKIKSNNVKKSKRKRKSNSVKKSKRNRKSNSIKKSKRKGKSNSGKKSKN